VDGQAVIQVPELQSPEITQAPSAAVRDTASTQVQVIMPASSTREGDAVCEGCGALGTVGRASRTAPSGEALEIHRFCARCWPEQSARYRARWSEEDRTWSDQFLRGRVPARGAGPGMHFESATWHGTLEFVRQIERTMVTPVPPSPQGLARIAADIAGRASNFDGEMPFAVEAFVQRYGAHAD
jgi:hypothetical protein